MLHFQKEKPFCIGTYTLGEAMVCVFISTQNEQEFGLSLSGIHAILGWKPSSEDSNLDGVRFPRTRAMGLCVLKNYTM